jgi:hypothetical protein
MTRRADRPAPGDHDPVTLEEACRLFLRGLVTPDTLRGEAKRGFLVLERLGRRDVVTRAEINSWRERCRNRKARASISERPATAAADEPPAPGSSSTEELKLAQDAALMIVEGLRSPSLPTSGASTSKSPPPAPVVVPIRSRSPT